MVCKRALVLALVFACSASANAQSPAPTEPTAYLTSIRTGAAEIGRDPEKALGEFEAAERAARSTGPEKSDAIAIALNLQASALLLAGRVAASLQRQATAIAMTSDLHGATDRKTSLARQMLGDLAANAGLWKDAYATYAAVAATYDTYTETADAAAVATFDLAFATAATRTSRFEIASARLLAALRLRAGAFGKQSSEVAEVFERAGALEAERGDYRTAIARYQTATKIEVVAKSTETAEMARIGIGLASADHAIGDLRDAEPPLRFAVAYADSHRNHRIRQEAGGALSSLLIDMGRVSEGVDVLLSGMPELATKPSERVTPSPTTTRDPQIDIDIAKSEVDRTARNAGETTLASVRVQLALERAYERAHRYDDARAAIASMQATLDAVAGPDHPLRADVLRAQADIAAETGDAPAAQREDLAAIVIDEKSLGANVQRTINARIHLGDDFLALNRYDEAKAALLEAAGASLANFEESAGYASESDRVDYARFYGSFAYTEIMRLCWTSCPHDPELTKRSLDFTLALKGAIARNVRELRIRVSGAGGDSLARFDRVRALRAQIAALRFAGDFGATATQATIRTLTDKANSEEGRLSRDSAAFAQSVAGKSASWRDIAAHLAPSEASVLLSRTPAKDFGERYLAFVIRATGDPVAVPLVDEKTLEAAPLAGYRVLVNADDRASAVPPLDRALYDAVWKPLEHALAGSTRVYVAPDGDLSQINLAVVPDDAGHLLFETRDIRVVSSLSDVLYGRAARSMRGVQTATLLGDPNFDARPEKVASNGKTHDVVRSVDLRDVKATLVSSLPGTKREIADVAALMRAHQWHVTQLVGNGATKSALEHGASPRVLHLATHGFFLDPPSAQVYGQGAIDDDPMLRSGLLLAGATESLRREDASAGGILTAFEASNLDLDNTELVVLSACDSGLGTVEVSDGVFGLRRAFHEAGAAHVMMSMWSVPDRETHELMKSFYAYWLGGSEMHAALAHAMRDERAVVVKRYGKDLPRMWGAFIID